MKNLLTLLVAACGLLCLSGCSSYYYSQLSSKDGIDRKDEKGDFIQENDSVCISYSFNGENAPVSISVYNKLNEPLFIDWMRSAVIIDDVSTSYYDAKASIKGESESSNYGSTYKYSKHSQVTQSYSNGSFAGEIALPQGVTFIPPKSKIEKTLLALDNFSFDKIPNDVYTQESFFGLSSTATKVRVKNFTLEDTPLCFRSYLTLYIGDPTGERKRSMSFDGSFYISRLIKAGNISPSDFHPAQRYAGDFFYVHNVKGKTSGLIIGGIVVGAAVIAVGASLSPDEIDLQNN